MDKSAHLLRIPTTVGYVSLDLWKVDFVSPMNRGVAQHCPQSLRLGDFSEASSEEKPVVETLSHLRPATGIPAP